MEDDAEETKQSADALSKIITVLNQLTGDERQRVLSAVSTFFGGLAVTSSPTSSKSVRPDFSSDLIPSPKEFMLQKQPKTDVERIACLAYYLAQYRDTHNFKTVDLAKINTEAAQPKFSNIAYSAKNALNSGYLAPAVKGQRQLSAAGEQFVIAMPDRDAAKAAMTSARPRRSFFRRKENDDEEE
jgi:hypothetical protein